MKYCCEICGRDRAKRRLDSKGVYVWLCDGCARLAEHEEPLGRQGAAVGAALPSDLWRDT